MRRMKEGDEVQTSVRECMCNDTLLKLKRVVCGALMGTVWIQPRSEPNFIVFPTDSSPLSHRLQLVRRRGFQSLTDSDCFSLEGCSCWSGEGGSIVVQAVLAMVQVYVGKVRAHPLQQSLASWILTEGFFYGSRGWSGVVSNEDGCRDIAR